MLDAGGPGVDLPLCSAITPMTTTRSTTAPTTMATALPGPGVALPPERGAVGAGVEGPEEAVGVVVRVADRGRDSDLRPCS